MPFIMSPPYLYKSDLANLLLIFHSDASVVGAIGDLS